MLQKVPQYVKIHLTSFLAIVALFVGLSFWLLPEQNSINNSLTNIYDQLGKADVTKSVDLEKEVAVTETNRTLLKIFTVSVYATYLTIITAIMATLLQFLFTKIRFTDDENKNARERILAASLTAATILVTASFIITFWPSALI